MEMLKEFIVPVTLVVCLCVGYILKNWIPTDAVNKFIPLIVGVLGVAITAWSAGYITPEIFAQGLVSGLASTGLHQVFAQFIKKE
jgi:hypothetical protein